MSQAAHLLAQGCGNIEPVTARTPECGSQVINRLRMQPVPAAEVQRNALAALADRFATIVPSADAIRD